MKNNKFVIIGIITIVVLCFVIVNLNNKATNNNHQSYTKPDYDHVAVINHSEMEGADAGTQYIYYIYEKEDNKNEYFYIKSKSSITIAGASERNDISSGELKNKSDLTKIKKDIKKDTEKIAETRVTYLYVKNGADDEFDNINDFGKKLFN